MPLNLGVQILLKGIMSSVMLDLWVNSPLKRSYYTTFNTQCSYIACMCCLKTPRAQDKT